MKSARNKTTSGFHAYLIAIAVVSSYFLMCILGEKLDNDILITGLSVLPTVIAIVFVLIRNKRKVSNQTPSGNPAPPSS